MKSYDVVDIRKIKDLIGKRRFSGAKKNILSLLAKNPNNESVRFYLAYIYHMNKENKRAKKEYLNVIKINRNNYWAHNNLGLIFLKELDIKNALFEFKTAMRINNRIKDAYYHLCLVYGQHHEDFKKALQNINRAIRLDKKNAIFYVCKGLCYSGMGKNKHALCYFQKAYNLDRKNIYAIYNLALEHENNEDYDKALSFYKILIKNLQDVIKLKDVYQRMGCVYLEKKQYNNAKRCIDSILKLKGKGRHRFGKGFFYPSEKV